MHRCLHIDYKTNLVELNGNRAIQQISKMKKIYQMILLDIDKINLEYMSDFEVFQLEQAISYLNRKYEINICSNDEFKKLQEKIKQLNIKSYISNAVTSEGKNFSKNNPIFFEYVATKVKFSDNNKMALIGHSVGDEILGALRFGIDTCFVNSRKINSNVIAPKYEIDSYQKIKTIF